MSYGRAGDMGQRTGASMVYRGGTNKVLLGGGIVLHATSDSSPRYQLTGSALNVLGARSRSPESLRRRASTTGRYQ
jgi:hypothetical protein